MSSNQVEIHMEVAFVGFGGNTGGGKYFYSYKPHAVMATQSPTTLAIALSTSTADEFVMVDLITSDGGTQISGLNIAPDGRSLTATDANTTKQLILMDVLIHDTKRDVTFVCDPQVVNRPI
jgi:hypothetical protein